MQMKKKEGEVEEETRDGTVDYYGRPSIRSNSGRWVAGIIILVNQGLATLAFFGVGVNLVLFLTRVLQQNNADAANNVSKWTGTVYIFSLVGAFLSDSYWGRYKTCAIFQVIFVIGLSSLSLSSYMFLIRPRGCGDEVTPCGTHSTMEITLFYLSIYLIALGNGGKNASGDTGRRIVHTDEFKFLDRAAYITARDLDDKKQGGVNPWRLCPVTQVEEVKCILRLMPIWLCTIIYSVVFTQMASLFVEQGAAMKTTVSDFKIPPASMSSFDILSVALFIFIYRRVLEPLANRFKKKDGTKGITELHRMGIGLVIAILAMVAAGVVECFRLKYADKSCTHCDGSSSLSIFWQVPQYSLIGASEVFMYVGQLEFFNAQTPDGLKSFGSALCMMSMSMGNFVSSLLVTMVVKISTEDHMPGWIPRNLNKGHLDRFYFLLAALTSIDLVVYIACARWYKCIKLEAKDEMQDMMSDDENDTDSDDYEEPMKDTRV
ncbi:unnamed protein product [Eruca vesicaria subsp. sativa]|uniref:Uncharacterized protein n=1 Tax=Eruca vesicaria subsp. sativa TaxID=29727 RepID=A0ABC8L2B4_ERUVS|nr:unnamed protein product [Eruca vesicaria subsp. sativa]